MAPDKSILIEQINAIIEGSISNLTTNMSDMGSLMKQQEAVALAKPYSHHSANKDQLYPKLLQSITGLEQRIESIEKLNEHLLYFIHFIYENFSKLVEGSQPGVQQSDDMLKRSFNFIQKTKGRLPNEELLPEITRRESEVLHLLSQGLCVKEIASELFISENTVVTHKKKLKEKFQARNTADLISRAFKTSK